MAGKVTRDQVVEDGLFAPTIQEGIQLLAVLGDLKQSFTDILKATREQAKTNAFRDFDDVEAAAKSMQDAKAAAEGLAEAEKNLKKVTDAMVRDFEAEEQVLRDVKGEYSANARQVAEYQLQIKSLKEEQKRLEKEHKLQRLSMDDLASATGRLKEREEQLKTALSQATQTLKAQTKESVAAEGSMDEMAQRLGRLRSAYRALSQAERENAQVGGVLLASIDQLDKEIKDLDASIGNHQRNVGNYGSALDKLPLGPTARGFVAVAAGEEGARKGAKELGKQFLKLLLNPIVLFIAAIATGLAALFNAFKRTDDGGTKFAAMLEQVKAVVDVLMQRLGLLANAVVNVLQGNWKEASEQFSQAISGVGDQLKNATAAAREYIFALDDLEAAEIGYISRRAQASLEIAKLEFLAQDRTASIEARRAALQEAIHIGEEELRRERGFAQQRFDIEIDKAAGLYNISRETLRRFIEADEILQDEMLKQDASLRAARNLMNDEGQKSLEEFYVKTLELDQRFFEENKRNTSRLTGFEEQIRKEREDAAKAYRDKQLRQQREYEDLLLANMTEGLEKQIATENLAFERRKKELVDNHRALEQLEILHKNTLIKIERAHNDAIKSENDAKRVEAAKKREEERQKEYNEFRQAREDVFQAALTDRQKEERAIEIEYNDKISRAIKFGLDTTNLEAERVKKLKEINDKYQKEIDEKQEKQIREQIKRYAEAAEALNKLAVERAEKSRQALDRDLQASQARAEQLRALALQGDKAAQDSIAAEEKRQAEIERKRERELQRAKRRELVLAGINTYNSKVQAGDKNALGSTIRDLTLLSAAIAAIPGFYEGTEHVASALGKPQLPGRDGYIIRVDGSERVVPGEENAKIGNITNDSLVRIAEMYQKGMLIPAHSLPAYVSNTTVDVSGLEKRLEAIEKNTANAPEYRLEWDKISKALIEVSRKGNHVSITKNKAGGLF